MTKDPKERRKHVRGEVPCRIYIYYPEERIISVNTDNVSQGGLKVAIHEELKVGSRVDIESYLIDEPIFRRGRVVWVEKKESIYHTGIEFTED